MKPFGVISLVVATYSWGCAGKAQSSAESSDTPCEAGVTRCLEDGHSEQCYDEAETSTEQVCTVAVAVDDETGNYCATKADGNYRCWGADADSTPPLPKAEYRRVQLTRSGLIGLKQDGSFASAGGFQVPTNTPYSQNFDSTNMWGDQTLCVVEDGRFAFVTDSRSSRDPLVRLQPGIFSTAVCAFEGLFCGIFTDGSISCGIPGAPPGNDWQSLTLSWKFLCGIRVGGQLECRALGCEASGGCEIAPRFPPGSYSQVASTSASACALDAAGALICVDIRGKVLLAHSGPFRALDAGLDVVCAVLRSGATLCHQQQPSGVSSAGEVESFIAVAPAAAEGF